MSGIFLAEARDLGDLATSVGRSPSRYVAGLSVLFKSTSVMPYWPRKIFYEAQAKWFRLIGGK